MEVHSVLGSGFLEAVYQEALAVKFESRAIPHRKEVQIPIFYRGRCLNTLYRADFVCFDSVIVELKSVYRLTAIEEAQVINYLRATKFQLGLLLNFGTRSLQYERLVLCQSAQSA